jgi:hypothetical protein
MKKALAAAVLLAAGYAPAALNAYRTGITLPGAVRLADGSVLPAGKYEVEIDYKGWGNAATLSFFQGGIFRGKSPAEARGFPSQPPGAAASSDTFAKIGDIKGETLEKSPDAKLKKVVLPGDEKVNVESKGFDKRDKVAPVPAPFDWAHAGFPAGSPRPGIARTLGDGSVKLSFDSTNSAAGFNAILPFIERGKEK